MAEAFESGIAKVPETYSAVAGLRHSLIPVGRSPDISVNDPVMLPESIGAENRIASCSETGTLSVPGEGSTQTTDNILLGAIGALGTKGAVFSFSRSG